MQVCALDGAQVCACLHRCNNIIINFIYRAVLHTERKMTKTTVNDKVHEGQNKITMKLKIKRQQDITLNYAIYRQIIR